MTFRAIGLCAVILTTASFRSLAEIHSVSLPTPEGVTRAVLHFIVTESRPKAVVVLCPGQNGSGIPYLENPAWVLFTKEHGVGLTSISFESSREAFENNTDYSAVRRGSGDALLKGIRKIYGKDLPLLLYGFSRGAIFVANFANWRPQRVVGWCAYSGDWWDTPSKTDLAPPGIIACGTDDHFYGSSLGLFLKGRSLGKQWTWVSLDNIGHSPSPDLEAFVQKYFETLLKGTPQNPVWMDVDLKTSIHSQDVPSSPTVAVWLPSESIAKEWDAIHSP